MWCVCLWLGLAGAQEVKGPYRDREMAKGPYCSGPFGLAQGHPPILLPSAADMAQPVVAELWVCICLE